MFYRSRNHSRNLKQSNKTHTAFLPWRVVAWGCGWGRPVNSWEPRLSCSPQHHVWSPLATRALSLTRRRQQFYFHTCVTLVIVTSCLQRGCVQHAMRCRLWERQGGGLQAHGRPCHPAPPPPAATRVKRFKITLVVNLLRLGGTRVN